VAVSRRFEAKIGGLALADTSVAHRKDKARATSNRSDARMARRRTLQLDCSGAVFGLRQFSDADDADLFVSDL
jgi:hypothetical protein